MTNNKQAPIVGNNMLPKLPAKPKGKRPAPGAGVPAWKKIAAELEKG